ncbi:MAG: molybdopterin-dependent oxidoreductase alpha subunit [Maribacter sp.]|jgi:molybdopterin-dependent oxidoreductase alpha subunit
MAKKLDKRAYLTPEKLSEIKLTKPKNFAAGLKGVSVAMEHAFKEMGTIRAMKTLAKMNQKGGFDCPGCAWPDPDDKRSLFAEYCENGAKALAEEATLKRTDVDFFRRYSIPEMTTWTDMELGKSGRLTHPMIKREGADYYDYISWEEAFLTIGESLKGLENPNEAVFYTSGRSSNEAAFLWGLFARAFGTNNMPDCSNMCHESSGVALSQTVGIGKGSIVLDDLEFADVILVAGQNPGTNHPRMLSALQKAKLNGAKVIAINPLEEAGLKRFKNPQRPMDFFTSGTMITDLFLQVKINQDIPLMKAILKGLLEKEKNGEAVFDQEFIEKQTEGYEALIADLDSYKMEDLAKQSGIPIEKINEAIDILSGAKKIICCWAMGLTQHKNGVATIKEYVNLLLLKGSIGIKGGGTCPVRGHSNVQGDRTVGIMHHVSPQLNQSIKKVFGFDAPDKTGLDVVHCIQAMHKGKAKIFIALGGNLLSAASDTYYTGEAFQNCDLTVSISTKLNRSHLATGKTALILPTLGRSEKDRKNGKNQSVTVENSMGKVHTSTGHLEPASDFLMSEPQIVAQIAKATLGNKYGLNWEEMGQDYALIREKISQVITGFNDYEKKLDDGGFYLPNNARKADFSKLPNQRAQFSVCPLPNHNLQEEDFLLMTIRSHDQFNTTIYGMNDRYRGIYNERRVVLMNPSDMERMGLKKLEIVNLTSHYKGVERRINTFKIVPYDIPVSNLAGYFPEMNPLIPIDEFADESQTPISKSIVVRIEKGNNE